MTLIENDKQALRTIIKNWKRQIEICESNEPETVRADAEHRRLLLFRQYHEKVERLKAAGVTLGPEYDAPIGSRRSRRTFNLTGFLSSITHSANRILEDGSDQQIRAMHKAIRQLDDQLDDLMDEITESAPCSSHCSTLSGKWSISTNEEEYDGTFGTMEEAIEEGKAAGYGAFWVGQCVSPTKPEDLFDGWSIESWLENSVYVHEDYMGDWAEGAVDASKEQREELAGDIRPLIAAWLDRHKLRPTHWNIDPATVRRIDVDDA